MQIYLDHAATTPMLPVAIDAWQLAAAEIGNAAALHAAGRNVRRIVEESREQIAAAVGAHPAEVVFTSGATEADNLAVLGIARARRAADPRANRVLLSAVEHPAVHAAAWQLAAEKFEIVEIPVGRDGGLQLAALQAEMAANPVQVALLSCVWVNNEIGVIEPIPAVCDMAATAGIPVHSDAVQALGVLPVSFNAVAAELSAISISAHKVGGPVGVGALLVRRTTPIVPISYGGGQERQLRSGTLAAPLVASFAAALDEVVRERTARVAALYKLRNKLTQGLIALGAEIIGGVSEMELPPGETSDASAIGLATPVELCRPTQAPHICYALFPGHRAETLLMLLDDAGVAASAGTACSAGVVRPSETLLALGYPTRAALSGVRFSLGWTTTQDDIATLQAVLPTVLARSKAAI
ncbi:MAG: cysteine desulfurase [Propionibacteriaceae bacterium]|nr:cysteine desulfurase [Propionibacteriaceae bacterium]